MLVKAHRLAEEVRLGLSRKTPFDRATRCRHPFQAYDLKVPAGQGVPAISSETAGR
jgi:hypothetical protein